jgi:hypothetical protein
MNYDSIRSSEVPKISSLLRQAAYESLCDGGLDTQLPTDTLLGLGKINTTSYLMLELLELPISKERRRLGDALYTELKAVWLEIARLGDADMIGLPAWSDYDSLEVSLAKTSLRQDLRHAFLECMACYFETLETLETMEG